VFDASGDGDFGGKMAKLEKVKYTCGATLRRYKSHKYCVLMQNKAREKRREKSYF
jgi:hypothetical protein